METESIYLRLMIEVADKEKAQIEVAGFTPVITAIAVIKSTDIQQYDKIPAYQEVTLHLDSTNLSDTYKQILMLSTSGSWSHQGDEFDRSAVWNSDNDSVLLSEMVRWAELALTRHIDNPE